jgi:hypothetical protein
MPAAAFPTYASPAAEGEAIIAAENGELAPSLARRADAQDMRQRSPAQTA